MDELVAVAYATNGQWVAMCPRGCMNAEGYGMQEAIPGRPGGLTDDAFLCSECGFQGRALWPPRRREIESLLNQRPFRINRNWLPGETLQQLFMENLEHGIVRLPAIEDVPDGKLFQITDDVVEIGPAALAVGMASREIGVD